MWINSVLNYHYRCLMSQNLNESDLERCPEPCLYNTLFVSFHYILLSQTKTNNPVEVQE